MHRTMLSMRSDAITLTAVPENRLFPPVSSPLFFGAALKDPICVGAYMKQAMAHQGLQHHNVTIREYDADHWIILNPEVAIKLREDLCEWIERTVVSRGGNAPQGRL